jgi:DNA-binding CsgD family transcriptional regulator
MRINASGHIFAILTYFFLGMYALYSVYNMFVIEAQLIGEPITLVYGVLCAAGIGGSVLFAAVYRNFERRPAFMRRVLGAGYLLPPVLTALSVLATLGLAWYGFFWAAVIVVFILIGFNLAMSASLIYLMMREAEWFGTWLGVVTAAGVAAVSVPAFIFGMNGAAADADYTGFLTASAVSFAAVVFLMALAAFRGAEIPDRLMRAQKEFGIRHVGASEQGTPSAETGALSMEPDVPLRRILICNGVLIIVFAFWIGANDVYCAGIRIADPAFFDVPYVLCLAPGLALGGILADVFRGRYLPLAAVACVLALAPLSISFDEPSRLLTSWVGGLIHGLFLFHISYSLPSVMSFGRHSVRILAVVGLLYYLGAGAGGLSSETIVAWSVQARLWLIVCAAFGVLFALLSFGRMPAVPPYPVPSGTAGQDPGGAPAEPAVESGRHVLDPIASEYGFSPREREVVGYLLESYSTAEIADAMFVTERTVQFHVSSLLRKTGMRTRTELVALFTQTK